MDQATEDAGQRDGLLHRPTWRGRGEGLKVEGEVMLDRSTRLDRLDLQSSTDVRKRRRSEWERFGMMLLPSLVFGSEIKGTRVL